MHSPTTTDPFRLHAVTKRYARGKGKDTTTFALGPLDLTVPRGYVTGLVGANGAGKTTAIKIALGLVRPDSGEAHLIDKARIGVVFDQPSYVGDWTATHVGRALAPFYPEWDADRYAELLAWSGIEPSKKVKELSRGMGMRLQLAVALSHGAELLVLDEPTGGLDPLARSELLEMIADFMTDASHSVLFSTHITSDLEKVADYITVLHAGRVVSATTRDELIDGYRLVRGPAAELDAVRPLVLGLREHGAGWEGLMATDDTVALGRRTLAEAPTLEEIVVHLGKEPSHV
ncbi:MAG: ABC transporter ATP-binding protein [Propioniciclava sp.]|uniref:ABC transporter ATP-binding protein n=1 Tax=Propioniciclava sp. TaxID=2038686 RepID=UPI0039E2EFD5